MFVITADVVTDVNNEVIDNGFVAGVFSTVEKANSYIDNVTETYMHKRGDYTISEFVLDCTTGEV